MESDSSDAERLPDLESLDDFLASSFDADIIVDHEDEVEGQENAGSLGLEPYRFEPFVEGAKHKDSDWVERGKMTLLSRRTASITESLAVWQYVAWRLAECRLTHHIVP